MLASAVHGLPSNWPVFLAELARYYGWSPSEIAKLSVQELLWWHEAAVEHEKRKKPEKGRR